MTLESYLSFRQAVIDHGFGDDIEWSENVKPPDNADAFAFEAIYVICNSGMKWTVASRIYVKVRKAVLESRPVSRAFGHVGKAAAIQTIWDNRAEQFAEYQKSDDKLAYLATLPWIGPITKYHLAKNFGVDCAKPDRHLERIAKAAGETVHALCGRLSNESGDRIATVDYVIWRAAERGLA